MLAECEHSYNDCQPSGKGEGMLECTGSSSVLLVCRRPRGRQQCAWKSGLGHQVLGLSGESMESYRVYSRDGFVKINDQACMRLDVYSYDENQGTNIIAGNFYLSSDGRRLYQFDEVNRKMTELSMTAS